MFGPPAWNPARLQSQFEGESPAAPSAPPDACLLSPERREMAAFIEELGIRRCSAIVPGLAEQLRDIGEARVRVLLLNLLPTQPEFALSSVLTRLAREDLQAGLGAIQQAVQARRIVVVADAHDRETLRAWRQKAAGAPPGRNWQVRGLLNRYPQAHPTVLMWSLFRKRLPVDALPSRVQRIMVDPVTCWALGRWLRTGRPMVERPIQVFQYQHRQDAQGPRLLMGRIGETVAEFCRRFDIATGGQVISNGMLAGQQIDPENTRIEPGTESLSLRPQVAPEHPTACLACGWCGDVCPTALTPVRLFDLAKRIPTGVEIANGEAPPGTNGGGDAARLLKTGESRESLHCIACGLCSYVCPARLPLTQQIVQLRLRVRAAAVPPPSRSPGGKDRAA